MIWMSSLIMVGTVEDSNLRTLLVLNQLIAATTVCAMAPNVINTNVAEAVEIRSSRGGLQYPPASFHRAGAFVQPLCQASDRVEQIVYEVNDQPETQYRLIFWCYIWSA